MNEKLKELREKRDASMGAEIIRMKTKLDSSYRMLEENYDDVCKANSQYLGNLSNFLTPGNLPKLSQFLREFQKLLFNYLASFSSYVDHTRRFVRHLRNPKFTEEYNRIKREKRIAEKTQFTRDLFNYSHHFELLAPGVGVDYITKPKGSTDSELFAILTEALSLRKKDLLGWERLHPISRDYLQKYPEREIIIIGFAGEGFLDECQVSTRELHTWLCVKVSEMFHSEITNFMETQSEIEKLELELREHSTPK